MATAAVAYADDKRYDTINCAVHPRPRTSTFLPAFPPHGRATPSSRPLDLNIGEFKSMIGNILLVLSFQVLALVAQWHVLAQQLLVPAWPLAVKNPFLNTWYQTGSNPAPLNEVWPNFWTPSTTGWYCGVQVDGVAYRLMGDTSTPAVNVSIQLSVGITPTQTIVQMQAGPVNVTMNFLSPITVRPNRL